MSSAYKWEIPLEDIYNSRVLLGFGGFGYVYRGTWRKENIPVAIKEVQYPRQTEDDIRAEVSMMAKLSHPNICKVYGVCFISNQVAWIILPLESRSLSSLLQSDEQIPWELQRSFIVQATNAVNYLHTKHENNPILHRDIKASNFLVRDPDLLLLTDFGTAKFQKNIKGTHIYTTNWAPPETLTSTPKWTEKSDIYCLGMVFYEIMSRSIPFEQLSRKYGPAQVITAIEKGLRPTLPDTWPQQLRDIISKCWHAELDERPNSQTLHQLVHELPQAGEFLDAAPVNQIDVELAVPEVKHTAKVNWFRLVVLLSFLFGIVGFIVPSRFSARDYQRGDLSKAVIAKNLTGVRVLVLQGADVNERDRDLLTPLMHAAYLGWLDVILELRQHNAKLDVRDYLHRTPLMLASIQGNTETVKKLVQFGAEIDANDYRIWTALMHAAHNGHVETVEALVELHANPGARDLHAYTALMLAAIKGHTETVKKLLQMKQGSMVDERDELQRTVLMLALARGQTATAEELIRQGADVRAYSTSQDTPFTYAVLGGCTSILPLLVNLGAEVDEQNQHGETALMLAARLGKVESISELIRLGTDLHIRNKDGLTAVDLAAQQHRGAAVEVLTKAEIKLNHN